MPSEFDGNVHYNITGQRCESEGTLVKGRKPELELSIFRCKVTGLNPALKTGVLSEFGLQTC